MTRARNNATGYTANASVSNADVTVPANSSVVIAGAVTIPNLTVNGNLGVSTLLNVTTDLDIGASGILNIIG